MLDLQKLVAAFSDLSEEAAQNGIAVLRLKNDASLLAVLRQLKSDPNYQMNMLLDLVAVDYAASREHRFELVYVLYSTIKNVRVLLKLAVSEQKPMVPSSHEIWKSANWAEREVFDMMGIKFLGHPNLKRLLLFEGFEGHPLRKDYPVNRRQKIPDVLEIP